MNKPARAHPAFPPELQPRDRTRAASAEQVAALAAKLDPRLLGETPTPGEGAPIVGPAPGSSPGQAPGSSMAPTTIGGPGQALVVESGNGRTLALRRAYGQGMESAGRYRRHLADRGFAVDGMKQPVLVRRRTTELTPERRVAFTRQANEATVARMGAAEQAAGDAERLGTEVLDLVRAPDLQAAANRPFVRAFIDALPASERAGLMAADGSLARAGAARIEAALLARAYGQSLSSGGASADRGADLTARLVESAPGSGPGQADELGPLGKALADAAPAVARLRAGIEAGGVAAEGDPVPGLLDAVRAVVQAREAKQPLDFPLLQEDMLGGGLGAEGRAWLGAMLHRTKAGVRLKGRGRLAELLDGVVGEAGKRAPGADMFGARPAGAGAILDAVNARQGQALRRSPETLFQPPPERPRPGVATGEARYVDLAEGRFVALDTGSPNLGSIRPDVAKAVGREAGPIRLAEGTHDPATDRGFGEVHIEARHGAELRALGFDDVGAFVLDVSQNFDAVYRGEGGAVLLAKRGQPTSMAIVELRPAEDGSGYWTVSTALAVRPTYLKRKRLLWEGEHRSRLGSAEGETPLSRGGQSKAKDGGSGRLEQPGEGAPRGAITLNEDGRAVIELFETADASTVVHETAHLFTRMMEDLSPHDSGLASDLGTLKRWTGAGDGPLLPAHHEKIATAFEAWVEGGAAPSGLEAAFRTLATFMARLFDGFKAQGKRATPEVEAVFERMLSVRPEAKPKPAPAPADPAIAAYDRLVREGRAHPDDIAEVEAWEREIARMGDLDAAYAQAAACVIAGLGAAA